MADDGETGLDPYILWRLDVLNRLKSPTLDEDPWWLTHIQLDRLSIEDLVESSNSDKTELFVPAIYEERAAAPDHRLIVAYARRGFFEKVGGQQPAEDAEQKRVANVTIGPEVPGFVPPEIVLEPPVPVQEVPSGTVIMAVIDDGIAFAHERFRTAAGGTRVEYAWIMEPGARPLSATVTQGRELTKREIDQLILDCTHAGALDEDRLYRLAGLIDFARPYHKAAAQRVGHGTHVMDLACGYDPGEMDGERPIICVQLPAAVTADTSLPSLEEPLELAFDYILDRASRFLIAGTGERPPVVVNFSYGAYAGPHDGTLPVEVLIDQRLRDPANKKRKVRAVLPAGNGNLARCHAEVRFAEAGGSVGLNWRVQPDDRTESIMEIWLPHTAMPTDLVTIAVRPPGGGWSAEVGIANRLATISHAGAPVGQISYVFQPHPTLRGRFLITLLPTFHLEFPLGRLAPCGLWSVRLTESGLGTRRSVHAWIQRDDTPLGYPPRGRQSYFDDPAYRRFDRLGRLLDEDPAGATGHARRSGTINAIATGYHPIVVAGHRQEQRHPADYSATGPVLQLRTLPIDDPPRSRAAPTVSAVCDVSPVRQGLVAAGTRSGSRVALNGTSVAAPLVARRVADELSLGRPAMRADLWDMAAAQDPGPAPPKPAATRVGGGRLGLRPHERVRR